MKHIKYIILISVTAFLSSCTDFFDREIPHPEYEEFIVLNGLLEPSKPEVTIIVSRTLPLYGDEDEISKIPQFIDDAVVEISDGTNKASLPYKTGSFGHYTISQSTFPIEAGKTYTVTVTSNGKTVSATTRVPSGNIDVNSFKLKYDTISYVSLDNDKRKRGVSEIEFKDIADEDNYYRISGICGDLLHNAYFIRFGASYFTLTDSDKQNGVIGPIFAENYLALSDDISTFQCRFLVETIDEHLFKYYHYLNGKDTEGGLFSEPTITYTNVTNGLGILCSKNEIEVVIQL